MNPLVVRDLVLGQGCPKIVVPLVGADTSAVLGQLAAALEAEADLVEWRADYFEALEDTSALDECLLSLRLGLGNVPLLFTLRSFSQGGARNIDEATIVQVVSHAIESGYIDVVDIELNFEEDSLHTLCTLAQQHGVAVVVSSHTFEKTPTYDELYATYRAELDAGASVCKLAVMACEEGDELRLMAATSQFAEDNPDAVLVGISMGELGAITRLAGEFFGSACTFCAACASSAPGQIDARLARTLIQQLHTQGSIDGSIEALV